VAFPFDLNRSDLNHLACRRVFLHVFKGNKQAQGKTDQEKGE